MQQDNILQRLITENTLTASLDADAPIATGSNKLAKAAVSSWSRLAACLAPVIGERGVYAVYSRSLYLTVSNFPWLDQAQEPARQPKHPDMRFSNLEKCLLQREATEVASVQLALLITFAELLAGMIGASLAEQLLRAAWPHEPDTRLGLP